MRRVVFEDGTVGMIEERQASNLYIENRSTKNDWLELLNEMKILGIKEFEDLVATAKSGKLIGIDMVKAFIKIHIL